MPGFIGKKVGMTRVVAEDGKMVPVTVLQVPENTILHVKTEDKDGYTAYVVGVNPREKYKVPGKKYTEIKEFRFEDGSYEKGKPLSMDAFEEVEEVSITGTSKGKGFQGGIKRHGFKGLRATHGSKYRRAIGSTGTRKPRRTAKGKKMPGHMGVDTVTNHKRKLVRLDKENSLVAVKGSVPGATNSYIYIFWK